jgi:hypothetical protein
MYVSRRALNAFPSRKSWDLGKSSASESGKSGANPTPAPPDRWEKPSKGPVLSNDPLALLETLELLERPPGVAEEEQGDHE